MKMKTERKPLTRTELTRLQCLTEMKLYNGGLNEADAAERAMLSARLNDAGGPRLKRVKGVRQERAA